MGGETASTRGDRVLEHGNSLREWMVGRPRAPHRQDQRRGLGFQHGVGVVAARRAVLAQYRRIAGQLLVLAQAGERDPSQRMEPEQYGEALREQSPEAIAAAG